MMEEVLMREEVLMKLSAGARTAVGVLLDGRLPYTSAAQPPLLLMAVTGLLAGCH